MANGMRSKAEFVTGRVRIFGVVGRQWSAVRTTSVSSSMSRDSSKSLRNGARS